MSIAKEHAKLRIAVAVVEDGDGGIAIDGEGAAVVEDGDGGIAIEGEGAAAATGDSIGGSASAAEEGDGVATGAAGTETGGFDAEYGDGAAAKLAAGDRATEEPTNSAITRNTRTLENAIDDRKRLRLFVERIEVWLGRRRDEGWYL